MAKEASVTPEESGVTTTEHCYIIRKKGILGEEPIIKGTRTPVRAIVEAVAAGLCTGGDSHRATPPKLGRRL